MPKKMLTSEYYCLQGVEKFVDDHGSTYQVIDKTDQVIVHLTFKLEEDTLQTPSKYLRSLYLPYLSFVAPITS